MKTLIWAFIIAIILTAFAIIIVIFRRESVVVAVSSGVDSGYVKESSNWVKFLECWKNSVSSRKNRDTDQMAIVNKSVDLSLLKIDENLKKIEKVEKKLGIKIPTSYRDYILVNGGMWEIEKFTQQEGHIWPVDKIGYFKKVDAEMWNVWNEIYQGMKEVKISDEKYFIYGEKQEAAYVRFEYLNDLIKIGDLDIGEVVLLNPLVVSKDGEYETWVLYGRNPGARRYRSFAEFMQHLAYRDINQDWGGYFSAKQLNSTCARYIVSMANVE